MILRSSDLQSDSDLDSIHDFCDVLFCFWLKLFDVYSISLISILFANGISHVQKSKQLKEVDKSMITVQCSVFHILANLEALSSSM